MKKAPLLASILLTAAVAHAQDLDSLVSTLGLRASGANTLQFARGSDPISGRPTNYLVNQTEAELGIRNISLRLRFNIEEPSMGYNPYPAVHREYLSRRTFLITGKYVNLEAGNVSTCIGSGLTMNLKEDPTIEKSAILDGGLLTTTLPWFTLKAIAGRPIEEKMPIVNVGSGGVTIQAADDLGYSRYAIGLQAETFILSDISTLSFLHGTSLGFGLVQWNALGSIGSAWSEKRVRNFYSGGVFAVSDSTPAGELIYYQPRTVTWLPSAQLNLSLMGVTASIEQAFMVQETHRLRETAVFLDSTADSSRYTVTAGDTMTLSPRPGHATYVSLSGQAGDFSLLAEFKNYHYAPRWKEYDTTWIDTLINGVPARIPGAVGTRIISASSGIDAYLDPPKVTYQHTWQLLTKHQAANLMGDVTGYNLMATWSRNDATTLTLDLGAGGRHIGSDMDDHSGENPLLFNLDTNYYEAYLEWTQELASWSTVRVGLDYGRLDPDQQREIFRTVAAKVNLGPFGKGHAFGFVFEGQANSKGFLAEADLPALKALIVRTVPPDSLIPYYDSATATTTPRDTMNFDYAVPNDRRSVYTQWVFNMVLSISYTFAPWLAVSATYEHEQKPESNNDRHTVTGIRSTSRNYFSAGLNIRPHENHAVKLEAGSTSGGKKCTLGSCVEMPPFEGVKLTYTGSF